MSSALRRDLRSAGADADTYGMNASDTSWSDSIDRHALTLRAWAKGVYSAEAAVELLIRTGFAQPGHPWCQPDGWVDFEILRDGISGYSSGEQRLLRIACSLFGTEPVDLSEDIPGLDRKYLDLVLAAIAHAGGSHEHSDFSTGTTDDPLHEWPASVG